MRRALLAAVAALALALALAVPAAAPATRQPSGCRTKDAGTHAEAVLGHFATRAEASRFVARIAAMGFMGFDVEDDGCGDFEVQSDNIERGQRTAFAAEAEQSKLQVTWEQTTPPDRPVPGQVVAVFGTRSTIAAANALAWLAAGHGFRYVDIAYSPGGWRVLEPGIPAGQQAAFRAEARRARLAVTFARR